MCCRPELIEARKSDDAAIPEQRAYPVAEQWEYTGSRRALQIPQQTHDVITRLSEKALVMSSGAPKGAQTAV